MSDYVFSFDDFEVTPDNDLLLRYSYKDSQGTVFGRFEEKYTLPVAVDPTDETSRYIIRQLHIIVGTSYYKSLLGEVSVPYELTESEAAYYNAVYSDGFGEYSYLNKLTEDIRPFRASDNAGGDVRQPDPKPLDGAILGIGGGKDSIVAAEIMKGIGLDTVTLDMATRDNHGQADAVMDTSGLQQLRVGRYLDTGIISFTAEHAGRNGHIPFSVILAWVGLLVAWSAGRKYVMMANEAATSSGNVMWNGRMVNHQWAKSYEAEKLTQDFVRDHISPNLWYFSPIRPYGSLAVMELFAKLGKPYFGDFTSCNLVLRIDPAARPNGRWCGQCAKCLSTWMLLSPRLDTATLTRIFDKDLSKDVSLRPTAEALLGLSGHKPLDCVGTTEELRAVTRIVLERQENWPLLEGITSADIPGPDMDLLIKDRSPANLPVELADRIENFVAANL